MLSKDMTKVSFRLRSQWVDATPVIKIGPPEFWPQSLAELSEELAQQ